MIPTVGRIVHFWTPTASEPRAALITHALRKPDALEHANEYDWRVVLRVFHPTGNDEVVLDAQFSSAPAVNHWTWPAVVR